jgi:uncharacterized protein YndB with AHSA1/START domain
MTSTRISQHINAPRAAVYHTLLDPQAIAHWRVPNGMTSHVHEFDAREGSSFRVSLTYTTDGAGKTTARTDTYNEYGWQQSLKKLAALVETKQDISI